MIFSKEYSKLLNDKFTTIRKRSTIYWPGSIVKITTPNQKFKATVISRTMIKKSYITEELAMSDADCSCNELIAMLNNWYGEEFDDFILLKLQKI